MHSQICAFCTAIDEILCVIVALKRPFRKCVPLPGLMRFKGVSERARKVLTRGLGGVVGAEKSSQAETQRSSFIFKGRELRG